MQFTKRFTVEADQEDIVSYLASKTELSKMKIKSALAAGAVRIKKGGRGKFFIVRRSQTKIYTNDLIIFSFDEKILALPELKFAEKLFQSHQYSVWIKPSFAPTQGTEFADHTSLMRYVSKQNKETFLIHRLDFETYGVVLFAHNRKSASIFSKMFQDRKIKKIYYTIVACDLSKTHSECFQITDPIDGKDAISEVTIIQANEKYSLLKVEIQTGRFHQIRRHLSGIQAPILGDTKEGKHLAYENGLQLAHIEMSFQDPFHGKEVKFTCPNIIIDEFKKLQ
jgi:tRNA pseudouridine32 synthase/23S rRNA pseudouridine746 synthase